MISLFRGAFAFVDPMRNYKCLKIGGPLTVRGACCQSNVQANECMGGMSFTLMEIASSALRIRGWFPLLPYKEGKSITALSYHVPWLPCRARKASQSHSRSRIRTLLLSFSKYNSQHLNSRCVCATGCQVPTVPTKTRLGSRFYNNESL